MKNTDWPTLEIFRIAQTSGKPLEVVSAEAFLGADGPLDSARIIRTVPLTFRVKLDVLAERTVDLDVVSVEASSSRAGLVSRVSGRPIPSFTQFLPSLSRVLSRGLFSSSTGGLGPLLIRWVPRGISFYARAAELPIARLSSVA